MQETRRKQEKRELAGLTWELPREGLSGSSEDAELRKQRVKALMQTHWTVLDTHTQTVDERQQSDREAEA